ncbi:MAG: hypothetical protein MPJ78_07940 [Hyphomicrobiaceae bacterium]|nr:hypothetical protein [Hyphomicrobiaceae bacterium]
MNLSAPTTPVFLVSVVLAILAVLGTAASIPVVSGNQLWFALIAYLVLFIGNIAKGL